MGIITPRVSKLDLEEIPSTFVHSPEYQGPKSLGDQIAKIAEVFDLDPEDAYTYASRLPRLSSFVPADVLEHVGWFAVPTVSALARRHFPNAGGSQEKFCQATKLVLEMVTRRLHLQVMRAENEFKTEYLQRATITERCFAELGDQQPGGICIVAGQLGVVHRGRKVRYARKCFVANEFGLDTIGVGSIVLVHPELFASAGQLGIDCSGDEFKPSYGGKDHPYDCAGRFIRPENRFEHNSSWTGAFHIRTGSATAFVP